MIHSSLGVLGTLVAIAAGYFALERVTKWKLFQYFPPLIFIYLTPVIMANIQTGTLPPGDPQIYTVFLSFDPVITTTVEIPVAGQPQYLLPADSLVYDGIDAVVLPIVLVMLLIKVDVGAALKVMGRGVGVMLMGTLGVVLGAPIAYLIVGSFLADDSWKAFGILSGSWIGGTGNMAAAAEMLSETKGGANYGLAVLADTLIYIMWLPVLLASKKFQAAFAKFTKVDPDRIKKMEAAAEEIKTVERAPKFQDHLYVLALALLVAWASSVLSPHVADGFNRAVIAINAGFLADVISASAWKVLLITTISIILSFTPAKRLVGSHELAMAFLYVFVARIGASANLSEVVTLAPAFMVGAFIWIWVHGAFCLLGAKLFRVDVHTAAIASAANIGGAASAPVVATHHRESLVPASILMAMIGYAVGNYAAFVTAKLCELVNWAVY